MSSIYTASRADLRKLFTDSRKEKVRANYERLLKAFSKQELEQQLDKGEGEIVDSINEMAATAGADNANVEVFTALGLTDFYYPDTEAEIAFEISDKVDPASITKYEQLTSAFETSTPVDCRVSSGEETLNFQIKRYPYPHLEFTPEAIVSWFEKVIGHYGDMSDTKLCILLQPSGDYKEGVLDIGKVTTGIQALSEQISFNEVVFTYNEGMQHMVLHKVHPEAKRLLIPLDWALARMRGDIALNF